MWSHIHIYTYTHRFLKLFTEVPLAEIEAMAAWEGAQLNKAKEVLADETTRLLHGESCLQAIRETAATLFGGSSGSSADLESLPKITLARTDLATTGGLSVTDLLVKTDMVTSKSEAKRLIKNGGARVNDKKVESDTAVVLTSDFDSEGRLKLSSGKKNHVLVVLS